MFKLIGALLLVSEVYGFIIYGDYYSDCGKRKNCWTVWNESLYRTKINYKDIDQFPRIVSSCVEVDMNIGWAQSHAQAFSWIYRVSYFLTNSLTPVPTPYIFSEHSFIKAVMETASDWMSCKAPQLSTNKDYDFITYLPFLFSYENTQFIHERNFFWPYDITSIKSWCNMTFLNSIPTTGLYSITFPGYDQVDFTYKPSWVSLSRAAKVKGIGLVGVPYDWNIAFGLPYYYDAIYRISGPTQFFGQGNVVGYWQPPNNNTIYFYCLLFGPNSAIINYLYVQASMVSIPGWVTFVAAPFL